MTLQTWNDETLNFSYYAFGYQYESANFSPNGDEHTSSAALFKYSVNYASNSEEIITVQSFPYNGYFYSTTFNGFKISGPSGYSSITNVQIDTAKSDLAGLSASDVTYSGNSASVNFEGLSFAPSTQVVIDVYFGPVAPTVTKTAPNIVESGQSTVVATVTPGLIGDTLTLIQTSQTAGGTLTLQSVNGVKEVVYTAAPNVSASTVDSLTYQISDENGDVVQGSASVQLDAGPAATNPSVTVALGQTLNLAGNALAIPGLSADTLSVASDNPGRQPCLHPRRRVCASRGERNGTGHGQLHGRRRKWWNRHRHLKRHCDQRGDQHLRRAMG